MDIRDALTFDDVLIEPAASSVLPAETDTRTRVTREIELGIPLAWGGIPRYWELAATRSSSARDRLVALALDPHGALFSEPERCVERVIGSQALQPERAIMTIVNECVEPGERIPRGTARRLGQPRHRTGVVGRGPLRRRTLPAIAARLARLAANHEAL